ncbi:MAG: hypothetical protein M1823_005039 [Watsoniomyces obsoletus]|nr:MAG: hypothetical protein M1823_005039 [Watsoniomyces obsoletus]
MADEPRRSGRATKGQHTKNQELDRIPVPVRSKPRKRNNALSSGDAANDDDDENDIIRCVCGILPKDIADGRRMVSCDGCWAWQHNKCMGLSDKDEDLPDKYLCEQCDPKSHVKLLEAIAKGEKPWEKTRGQKRRRSSPPSTPVTEPERKNKKKKVAEGVNKEKEEVHVKKESPAIEKKQQQQLKETQVKEKPQSPTLKKAQVKEKTQSPTLKKAQVKEKHQPHTQQEEGIRTRTRSNMSTNMGPPPLTDKSDAKKRKSRGDSIEHDEVRREDDRPHTEMGGDTDDGQSEDKSKSTMGPPGSKTTLSLRSSKSRETDMAPPTTKRTKAEDDKKSVAAKASRKKSVGTPSTTTATATATATATTQQANTPSQPPVMNESEPLTMPDQLQNTYRKNGAVRFIPRMEEIIQLLIKQRKYTPVPGTSTAEKARELVMAIEHHTHRHHNRNGPDKCPSVPYQNQLRHMFNNVKHNPQLCEKLLSGVLTPEAFALMSQPDMRTEEQKAEDERTARNAEQRYTRVEDDTPRIRRTHRGEEVVVPLDGANDDDHLPLVLPSPSSMRRDSWSGGMEMEMEMGTPLGSGVSPLTPYGQSAFPLIHGGAASGSASPTGDAGKRASRRIDSTTNVTGTTMTTMTTATTAQHERKSSTTTTTTTPFNIQDVWSSVAQSPHDSRSAAATTTTYAMSTTHHQHHHQQAPVNAVLADPEIDALLKDDSDDNDNGNGNGYHNNNEAEESPPYSPTDNPLSVVSPDESQLISDHDQDTSIMWQGSLCMPNVAMPKVVGKHIASSTFQEWDNHGSIKNDNNGNTGNGKLGVIPETLKIIGRIDPRKAMAFLCNLQDVDNQSGKSTTMDTDVMVIYPKEFLLKAAGHGQHQVVEQFKQFKMEDDGKEEGGYLNNHDSNTHDSIAEEEEGEKNKKAFESLWTYFKSRGKYGVVESVLDQEGNRLVVYVLPVDATRGIQQQHDGDEDGHENEDWWTMPKVVNLLEFKNPNVDIIKDAEKMGGGKMFVVTFVTRKIGGEKNGGGEN